MTDIGKEYGAALFVLACEEKSQKKYGEALDVIKAVFLENPEYQEFLSSPAISLEERLSAIDKAFSEEVPEHVLSYMKLLCEKGRISSFLSSVDEYRALLEHSERIIAVKVTSAVELTDGEKEKLRKKLEATYNGKVNIEYFIDVSLISGLKIDIDGKILDGSLRQSLHDIKEVMNI